MQVVPSGGQIWNLYKWCHLVPKFVTDAMQIALQFGTNASGATWLSNVELMHVETPGWQKLHGSTGGTRRKVWTRTKISLFGRGALHLPSLRSPVEEAQADLLLLREEVASLRSIFLSMTSQGHLASLMPASAGTCASRGSASRQSRCALGAFSSTEL